MQKETFSWKRLGITILLVLFAVGATAGTTYYFLNDAIETQKQNIASLQEQVDKLSDDLKKMTENGDADEENGYQDVTAEEAKKLIDENEDLIVIDVSPNYDEGHLPGAVSYYLADGSLDDAIESGELDKDATYLVYCHVDSVSIAGAKKLIEAGFENVYRLEGNYKAWVDAGYEIET